MTTLLLALALNVSAGVIHIEGVHPAEKLIARVEAGDAASIRSLAAETGQGADFVRLAVAYPILLSHIELREQASMAMGPGAVQDLQRAALRIQSRLASDGALAAAVSALQATAVSPQAALASLD